MGRKKPNVPRAGVKRGGKIKRKCNTYYNIEIHSSSSVYK